MYKVVFDQVRSKRLDHLVLHCWLTWHMSPLLVKHTTHSNEIFSHHVPHTPALVAVQTTQRSQEMLLAFVNRQKFSNRAEYLDGQQSDRVLIVLRAFKEERNDCRDQMLLGDLFCKFLYKEYRLVLTVMQVSARLQLTARFVAAARRTIGVSS